MFVNYGPVVGFSLIELAEGLQGMAEMKASEGGVPGVGELGKEVFVESDNVLRVFCFLKAILNFLAVGVIFFGVGKEAVFVPVLRGSWYREAAEEKQCQKIPESEGTNHGNRDWTYGLVESGIDVRNWHVSPRKSTFAIVVVGLLIGEIRHIALLWNIMSIFG